MHYAINKLHWSPSAIEEWLAAEQTVKAFYFASIELKVKHEKREAEKAKNSKKRKR